MFDGLLHALEKLSVYQRRVRAVKVSGRCLVRTDIDGSVDQGRSAY
jgi:hypothetical protein